MTCNVCGEQPKHTDKDFTKAVIEINNPETLVLLRKVTIPASMGDDTTVPPVIGKYYNVILNYEANNKTYLYSSDGVPTLLETSIPESILKRISDLEDYDVVLHGDIQALDNKVKAIEDYSSAEVDTGAVWIDGSHIYKKTFDTGALPNNTIKSVAHNLGASLKRVIKIDAYAFGAQFSISIPMPNMGVQVMISDSDIEITTNQDYTQFAESYVTLYYTKNS